MNNPAYTYAAVTPSDSVMLQAGCRSLYVGTQGDVTVVPPRSSTAVLFKDVVGLLPIQVAQVKATGTTATNIVALY